jgi:dihydrofolate reductase
VALDKNNLIGDGSKLPWYLPNDLAYFKEKTMGHVVVMGRKTFDSIGKKLPGRYNLVLTRNKDQQLPKDVFFTSDVDYIKKLSQKKEVFVIGGSEIYNIFIDSSDKLYMTEIEAEFEGNTFFKGFDPSKWNLISEKEGIVDDKNRYVHTFKVYSKK